MKAAQILTLVGLVFFLLLSPLSCWYANDVKNRESRVAWMEFNESLARNSKEGVNRASRKLLAADAKLDKWNFSIGVFLVTAVGCAVAHIAIQNIRKEKAKK